MVLPSFLVSRGSLEDISIKIDLVFISNSLVTTSDTILLLGNIKITASN